MWGANHSERAHISLRNCLKNKIKIISLIYKLSMVQKATGEQKPIWCWPWRINHVFLPSMSGCKTARKSSAGRKVGGRRCLNPGSQGREERKCFLNLSKIFLSCNIPTVLLNLPSLEKSSIYPFNPFAALGDGDTMVREPWASVFTSLQGPTYLCGGGAGGGGVSDNRMQCKNPLGVGVGF